MSKKSNRQNIAESIQLLFPEPCVVEIRSPKAGRNGTISGYFQLPEHSGELVCAVEEISGDYNVYWTLNRVSPSLLARAANKIKHHTESGSTTSDTDIIRRCWLPIDFDPQRPTGISASNVEKEAARQLVKVVRKWLTEAMGWPDPLIADSGNGYHGLYRVDLPNDDESRDLLKAVLEVLAEKFDNQAVKVDTKLYNASRILKVYGSMATKGDNIPDRPHCLAQMFAPTAPIEPVTLAQLQAVAALKVLPEKKKARQAKEEGGGWTDAMVEAGLTAAKVEFRAAVGYKGGQKWQHACLDHPEEHRSPDCFTMRDDRNWVASKCSHNSCGDGLNSVQWVARIEELAGHAIEKPKCRTRDVRGLLAAMGMDSADPNVAEDRRIALPPEPFPLTELGNAQRFAWRYAGKFLHTAATGWLAYEAGRWRRDKSCQAEQALLHTLNLITLEAELTEDEDAATRIISWAFKSEAHSVFSSSLKFATNLKAFARDYAIFDRRPNLFLCANGTLDLASGEFASFDAAHCLTKGSNVVYDPTAACPQWEKFALEVMGGKEHMVRYLARSTGYSLSSDTGEQCLFVPHGTGGTGKSTFLNVLQGVLGDYCRSADPEMFMSKRGDSGQPFELAGLEGVRALFAVETEDNKELACAKVKRMTGGDEITACYKHRDSYRFVPSYKIWLATNDKPRMNATDDAMWDRPKLIPFDVRFRGERTEVRNLAKKLIAEEASGILNWMLVGYREWKEGGLQHPEEVVYAVQEWRGDEDYLGRFLSENTVSTANQPEFATKVELFSRFNGWAEIRKEGQGMSEKRFSEMMKRKGFVGKAIRQNGKPVKVWLGLKYIGTMGRNYSEGLSQMPNPDAL